MINLLAQQLLDRIHELVASREHAVNPIAGMVPEGKPDLRAGAVVPAEGMLVEKAVFFGRASEKINLLSIKKSGDADESVLMIRRDLRCSELSRFHRCLACCTAGLIGSKLRQGTDETLAYRPESSIWLIIPLQTRLAMPISMQVEERENREIPRGNHRGEKRLACSRLE